MDRGQRSGGAAVDIMFGADIQEIVNGFHQDFLTVLKVLEDFSPLDDGLTYSLQALRDRVEAKSYKCVPDFWDDLRISLQGLEEQRGDQASRAKTHQVMKQIDRLEVKFLVKEQVNMLCDFDPDFRLERMVDWINDFKATKATEAGENSSGSVIVYQVLSNIDIQKDMGPTQREALQAAVRDNMHKFPVSMHANLERVGSLYGGVPGPPVGQHSDWRRKNQSAAPQEQPPAPESLGAPSVQPIRLASVTSAIVAPPGQAGPRLLGLEGMAGLDGGPTSLLRQGPADNDLQGGAAPHMDAPSSCSSCSSSSEEEEEVVEQRAHVVEERTEPGEEILTNEPEEIFQVDPGVVKQARRSILAVLSSNRGEIGRKHVRKLLKQVGAIGLPIAGLGEGIFFSGHEVFLRRADAYLPAASSPVKAPLPQELRVLIVSLVRDAGLRITLPQLTEKLQWHAGSMRHTVHGPLRRALGQVPEIFFEPEKVFSTEAAAAQIACLAGPEDETQVEAAPVDPQPALYIADPFAELIATIYSWLQGGQGVLDQEPVLALVKALAFKPRVVIAAVAKDVVWSHADADVQVLLRTAAGAAQHPKPLPDVYLHPTVKQNLLHELRLTGPKPKVDVIAGKLHWNLRSDLRKAYGHLRIVLAGLREVFFDPHRIYLKRLLDGIVEWPLGRHGRLGPNSIEDPGVQHWTTEADDLKRAGDPDVLNIKRQVLGMVMSHGGRCDAAILRRMLQALNGEVALEDLFQPGTPKDLSSVLFWSTDMAYALRAEAIGQGPPAEAQVPENVSVIIVEALRHRGYATLGELKALLDTTLVGAQIDEPALSDIIRRMPEAFFAPEMVFLRHIASSLIQLPQGAGTVDVPHTAEMKAAEQGAVVAGEAESFATRAGGGASDRQSSVSVPAGPPHGIPAAPLGGEASTVAGDGDTGGAALLAGAGSVATAGGSGFFSFSEFATVKRKPIPEDTLAKRQRTAEQAGPISGHTAAWDNSAGGAPLWATEGIAVLVSGAGGSEEGVIVRANSGSCTVRLTRDGVPVEGEFATPSLMPKTPTAGAVVKVVGGDRTGCHGTMVGLAGGQGVVQIGKMSYETLPMNQIAVLAG